MMPQVIRHPNYNSNTLVNDIALLRISNQPTASNYIQPVCLPKSIHHNGEDAVITGWGTTSEG
jgi:hypothetical protein